MVIPVYRPHATPDDIAAVTHVLQSGYWGHGPVCKEFESEFSRFLGVKHCFTTTSCTAALFLAGKVMDLRCDTGKPQVIIPAITWISTALLAEHNGYEVVFADVEPDTLNISAEDVLRKITPRTKAVVAMHHSGNACDLDAIIAIAREHDLRVVEDCAHAIGGLYKGRPLGSFGDLACFSFQAVKNVSSGDGGMLVTNNDEYATKVKPLRWLGMNIDSRQRIQGDRFSWDYDVAEFGYKLAMNDVVAALGLSQFKRVDKINVRRRELADRYRDAFSGSNVGMLSKKPYAESSNHVFCLKVVDRGGLADVLAEAGIHTNVHYKPLYKFSVYASVVPDCPNAESVWPQLITIPLYPELTESEQDTIIKIVKGFCG